MLVYLARDPALADAGHRPLRRTGAAVGAAPPPPPPPPPPYVFDGGLIFIPVTDTWHGFAPRPIRGVRKSLIVNYVDATWRARHELAEGA